MLIRGGGPTSPRTLVRRQNAVLKNKREKAVKMNELLNDEIENPGKVTIFYSLSMNSDDVTGPCNLIFIVLM